MDDDDARRATGGAGEARGGDAGVRERDSRGDEGIDPTAVRRGAREERDVLRARARGAREARTIGAMALMRMVESGEPTRSLTRCEGERGRDGGDEEGRSARVEKTAREIEARTPRVVEDVERACGSEVRERGVRRRERGGEEGV